MPHLLCPMAQPTLCHWQGAAKDLKGEAKGAAHDLKVCFHSHRLEFVSFFSLTSSVVDMPSSFWRYGTCAEFRWLTKAVLLVTGSGKGRIQGRQAQPLNVIRSASSLSGWANVVLFASVSRVGVSACACGK